MTFTFATNLSTDLALVRFHIGDTTEAGAYLADETITALLTSEGTVGGAVIACIKYIITQLSVPDFRQDWAQILNVAAAREGFEALLLLKESEFGLQAVSITVSNDLPYRVDSYQDADSTAHDGKP